MPRIIADSLRYKIAVKPFILLKPVLNAEPHRNQLNQGGPISCSNHTNDHSDTSCDIFTVGAISIVTV